MQAAALDGAELVGHPKLGMHQLPIWEASEKLWQTLSSAYFEEPGPQRWEDAIEPIRRRVERELQLIQAIGLAGASAAAISALHSYRSRKATPVAAAMMIVGVGLGRLSVSYGRLRQLHPVDRYVQRWTARTPHQRVDGVMAFFLSGELHAFRSTVGHASVPEEPVSFTNMTSELSPLLLHPSLPARAMAARRLKKQELENLVVDARQLDDLLAKLRPLAHYQDLIGMPLWILERAEKATRQMAPSGRSTDIDGGFLLIRNWLAGGMAETEQQRLDRLDRLVRQHGVRRQRQWHRFEVVI